MKIESKIANQYLTKGGFYNVISISVEKNEIGLKTGYYLMNNNNQVGFYSSEQFKVNDNSIFPNACFIHKPYSVLICPKEFLTIDDFWEKLSNEDEEAVNCVKSIFPEL